MCGNYFLDGIFSRDNFTCVSVNIVCTGIDSSGFGNLDRIGKLCPCNLVERILNTFSFCGTYNLYGCACLNFTGCRIECWSGNIYNYNFFFRYGLNKDLKLFGCVIQCRETNDCISYVEVRNLDSFCVTLSVELNSLVTKLYIILVSIFCDSSTCHLEILAQDSCDRSTPCVSSNLCWVWCCTISSVVTRECSNLWVRIAKLECNGGCTIEYLSGCQAMTTLIHYHCTAFILDVSIVAVYVCDNGVAQLNCIFASLCLFCQSCNVCQCRYSFFHCNSKCLAYIFVFLIIKSGDRYCDFYSTGFLSFINIIGNFKNSRIATFPTDFIVFVGNGTFCKGGIECELVNVANSYCCRRDAFQRSNVDLSRCVTFNFLIKLNSLLSSLVITETVLVRCFVVPQCYGVTLKALNDCIAVRINSKTIGKGICCIA